MNHLSRGKVLTSLFVILFVELSDQFFEDVAHAKI